MFEDLTEDQRDRLKLALDSKIDKKGPDDCWNWTGATDNSPKAPNHHYGKLKLPRTRKTIKAHRAAFYIANDEDPGDMFVMHACDNPLCCNPNHLSLGSHQDNMFDMRQKKRVVYDPDQVGSKNRHAKLTEQDVLDIRASCAEGAIKSVLAAKYGVCYSSIDYIVKRKTWKHI